MPHFGPLSLIEFFVLPTEILAPWMSCISPLITVFVITWSGAGGEAHSVCWCTGRGAHLLGYRSVLFLLQVMLAFFLRLSTP